MDNLQFWERKKSPSYNLTPYNIISHCNKVCQVFIEGYSIEVLWDYRKKCVLIQDGTHLYQLTHNFIGEMTIRQVIIGLGFKYMETFWSSNGKDVLDILVHNAPLSTIRILTLDDMDICEKL